MTGKITFLSEQKSWTAGDGTARQFFEFKIETDERLFTAWQPIGTRKLGDDIEFDAVQGPKGWKATLKGASGGKGGGGFRKSPEEIALMQAEQGLRKHSFALSYAKDITIGALGVTIPLYFNKSDFPADLKFTEFHIKVQQLATEQTIATAKELLKSL